MPRRPGRGRHWAFVAFLIATALSVAGCGAGHHRRYDIELVPDGLEAGPAPVIHGEHAIAIDAERVRLTRDYLRIHVPEVAAKLATADTAAAISFTPRMIVVHWTAIPTLDDSLDTFRPNRINSERTEVLENGSLNVGAHFLVDRGGAIYSLYPETVIARHVIGLNHVALGIENVGNGDLDDISASAPLTREQLAADVSLVRYLAHRYPTIHYLIGHMEYRDVESPRHPAHALFAEAIPTYRTEKIDPGPAFLKALRDGLRRPATSRSLTPTDRR